MEEFPEGLRKYYEDVEKYSSDCDGRVYKCVHKTKKTIVLIKEVSDYLRQAEAKMFFRKLFIWLDLLNHENILQLYYVHRIDNKVYLAYEHMASDLHAVARAQILLDVHIRYFTYEILRLFKYAHSAGLIFRDLRSLLFGVNEDCTMKLMELNDAFVQGDIAGGTEYRDRVISNRWYHPPEHMVGTPDEELTPAYDMWALGCILGEMLGKTPFTGYSMMNQMERIVEFVGFPTQQDLEDMKSPYVAAIMEAVVVPQIFRDFKEIYPNASEDALDLLKKLLQFNPKKRITADEALKHKFVAQFHGCMPENECPNKITFPFDDAQFSDKQYIEKILQEFIAKLTLKVHEPLTSTLILAHNIARSSEALALLPIEIWLLIFKMMDGPAQSDDKIGLHEKTAAQVFNRYFRTGRK